MLPSLEPSGSPGALEITGSEIGNHYNQFIIITIIIIIIIIIIADLAQGLLGTSP